MAAAFPDSCCDTIARASARTASIVGSSVGAVNGAYVAATLPDGDTSLATGREIWENISWGDVLATPSHRDLSRIVRGVANFTGLLSLDIPALLDATPLAKTLAEAIPFDRINEQVYMVPVTIVPTAYLHSSELVFRKTPGFSFLPRITDFHWTK